MQPPMLDHETKNAAIPESRNAALGGAVNIAGCQVTITRMLTMLAGGTLAVEAAIGRKSLMTVYECNRPRTIGQLSIRANARNRGPGESEP